jgi:hypothetical protein
MTQAMIRRAIESLFISQRGKEQLGEEPAIAKIGHNLRSLALQKIGPTYGADPAVHIPPRTVRITGFRPRPP